jgi:hypothetical protein
MKTTLLTILFITFSITAMASDLQALKSEIDSLEETSAKIKNSLRSAKGAKAEELFNQYYFSQLDILDLYLEVADTVEDKDEASDLKEKTYLAKEQLDSAYLTGLEAIKQSTPPEASGLSVRETHRNYGYVYLSAKIDVDNPGEARKIFITVKGLDSRGYELESVLFSGQVEAGGRITLTDTMMLSEQLAADIRTWNIAAVKYYRQ